MSEAARRRTPAEARERPVRAALKTYGKFSPTTIMVLVSNICTTISVVGERSHDRQLTEARTAYVAAVFRLLKAMDAFNASAFPLDPGSGTD